MTNRFPLVPLVEPTILPSPNEPGVKGHGEGLEYGKEIFSQRPAYYYYRFAGKTIPKDAITYVSHESGYFSRQQGERSQLIIAFDEEVNAFRVLAKTSTERGDFKETMEKLKQYASLEEILTTLQREAEREKAIVDDLQAALERGDDIF